MSRVFTPTSIRLGVIALVVIVFVVVGAVLISGNANRPAPQHRTFQLHVSGSTMTPDRIEANEGDTLSITVDADKAEEIHLHGYDKAFELEPGKPATMTFDANLTGSFDIEIEGSGTGLGSLEVHPRGGLFGIGR